MLSNLCVRFGRDRGQVLSHLSAREWISARTPTSRGAGGDGKGEGQLGINHAAITWCLYVLAAWAEHTHGRPAGSAHCADSSVDEVEYFLSK